MHSSQLVETTNSMCMKRLHQGHAHIKRIALVEIIHHTIQKSRRHGRNISPLHTHTYTNPGMQAYAYPSPHPHSTLHLTRITTASFST